MTHADARSNFLKGFLLALTSLRTDGCTSNYGLGDPCIFPYTINGDLHFTCTTRHKNKPEEGFLARCPTKMIDHQRHIPSQEDSDWGLCHTDCRLKKYLDNQEVVNEMMNLEALDADLVQIYVIGESVKGENLTAARLTKGANRKRKLLKPMVRFVGNMHGNEVVGREMLVQLARTLVQGYGLDGRITNIMDSMEIHLLPSLNPDGWRRASEGSCGGQDFQTGRWNENKIDLNRDFPTWREYKDGQLDLGIFEGRQPETKAMMEWSLNNPFLLAANLHDGAIVASYPWDHYRDQQNGPHFTMDQAIFQHLADTYAYNHGSMINSSACAKYSYLGPTTNGADWYPKNGTLKDFSYLYTNCMELVLELSCCKFPNKFFLTREWDNNRESLLSFLELANTGVRGQVERLGGAKATRVEVRVEREGGRLQGTNITTNEDGEFWKILLPGRYKIQAFVNTCEFSGKMPFQLTEANKLKQIKIVVRKKFGCIEQI